MKKKRVRRLPMIEVRHSKVHGYGVFALRRIRKGTMVTEYLGDRISHDEADTRYENKAATDNHTFLFTVDARTVIDGGVGGNEARYINHGCDPNCESTTLNRRVFIEAIRTIQKGEELAYDYQIQRDADDPADVDVVFACRCGAAACRGSMLEAPKKKRRHAPAPAAGAKRRDAKRRATKPRRAKPRAAQRRSAAPLGARSGRLASSGTRGR